MSKKIYFRVGSELTTDQLKRYDWRDMQMRDLNDPRFAGCESNFNWRQYIEVRFDNKEFQKQVIKSLDQIAVTPEGQHTIRQAYAMQNYRIRAGQTDYAVDQKRKLYISDKIDFPQTGFIPPLNAIMAHKKELDALALRGIDGNYYHASLTSVIYHELCHVKDGFNERKMKGRYYYEIKGKEIDRNLAKINTADDPVKLGEEIVEKHNSIIEYPAIRETNSFMKKYFGEVPRALRHDATREKTWYSEIFGLTKDQPHLPEGIDYNSIPNLPIPSCKKAAQITRQKC